MLLTLRDRALDEALRLVVEQRQTARPGTLAVGAFDLGADARDLTVLVPDCLVTCMRTPGWPLMRRTERLIFGRVRRRRRCRADKSARRPASVMTRLRDLVRGSANWPGLRSSSGAVALVDLADRDVLVFGAEDRVTTRSTERSSAVIFSRDEARCDLAAQTAADRDRRDAGDALDARRQRVFRQLAQRHAVGNRPLDADAHDRRRGRVELLHDAARSASSGRRLRTRSMRVRTSSVAVAEVGAPGEVQAGPLPVALRWPASSSARGPAPPLS